jgi:hypothetical protein
VENNEEVKKFMNRAVAELDNPVFQLKMKWEMSGFILDTNVNLWVGNTVSCSKPWKFLEMEQVP